MSQPAPKSEPTPDVEPACDISGKWYSNIGGSCQITQTGSKFTWTQSDKVSGKGTISGENITFTIGSVTLEGKITEFDAFQKPVKIGMTNNVVFTRPPTTLDLPVVPMDYVKVPEEKPSEDLPNWSIKKLSAETYTDWHPSSSAFLSPEEVSLYILIGCENVSKSQPVSISLYENKGPMGQLIKTFPVSQETMDIIRERQDNSANIEWKVTMPDWGEGKYQLTAFVDSNERVSEPDESNNNDKVYILFED